MECSSMNILNQTESNNPRNPGLGEARVSPEQTSGKRKKLPAGSWSLFLPRLYWNRSKVYTIHSCSMSRLPPSLALPVFQSPHPTRGNTAS